MKRNLYGRLGIPRIAQLPGVTFQSAPTGIDQLPILLFGTRQFVTRKGLIGCLAEDLLCAVKQARSFAALMPVRPIQRRVVITVPAHHLAPMLE